MNYRELGNTGLMVSEVSFGTWAIGGAWGKTNDSEALKSLEYAIDQGVNFFDTADVYGDGHSEELLAKATKGQEDKIHIATKFCRQGDIFAPENYSYETVKSYCEDSLRRLNRETITSIRYIARLQKYYEMDKYLTSLTGFKRKGKSVIME